MGEPCATLPFDQRRISVARGAWRVVLLVGPYAVKLPHHPFGRWRWGRFLRGMLANMQEVNFSRHRWPELCPVLFSIPGGFALVMRRAALMTQAEFDAFDYEAFISRGDGYALANLLSAGGDGGKFDEPEALVVAAERTASSFGKLDGRVVAIDYGGKW